MAHSAVLALYSGLEDHYALGKLRRIVGNTERINHPLFPSLLCSVYENIGTYLYNNTVFNNFKCLSIDYRHNVIDRSPRNTIDF